MATKQDFTADEWAKVMQAPMLASVAVSAAEPSGIWGTLKEGFANASSMLAGRSSGSPLIGAIIADMETSEGRTLARDGLKEKFSGAKAPDIVQRSLAGLQDVARILDAKAGSDFAAVKSWLVGSAQKVAEASSEGGFLGFGGVKVSEHEKATLDQIKAALGG